MRKLLPNSNTVLVLGILSIVMSFCYGVVGIVLGIIALVISKKDLELYRANPEEYDGYSNLNTGRICSIVGICLGGLVLIATIVYFVFIFSLLGPIFESAARGNY
jgi:ABC-type nickel/cobalt efflux system permease component RcnA